MIIQFRSQHTPFSPSFDCSNPAQWHGCALGHQPASSGEISPMQVHTWTHPDQLEDSLARTWMREVSLHRPGAVCRDASRYLELLATPSICFIICICLHHSPHEDVDVHSMVLWSNCEAQSMQAVHTLHLSTFESLVSLANAPLDDFIGTC